MRTGIPPYIVVFLNMQIFSKTKQIVIFFLSLFCVRVFFSYCFFVCLLFVSRNVFTYSVIQEIV